MPRAIVPVLKFVGTISLGLLTGVSYAHYQITSPALLTLPSANAAQTVTSRLRATHATQSTALLIISISSYTLAYALSSPSHRTAGGAVVTGGGRHPYLIWTSLVSGLGWAVCAYVESRGVSSGSLSPLRTSQKGSVAGDESEDDYIDATHSTANLMTPTSASESGGMGLYDDAERRVSLNGEGVRRGIERFGTIEGVRAGISGLALTMAVIGIWGDGAGLVRRT